MSDETRLKRLKYRAHHRGFREADLLLGAFADSCLELLTAAELDDFETLLLTEQDQDIYDWAIDKTPVPARYDTSLMARLKAFNFAAKAPWRH
jgi:antitoxin CptB